MADIDVVPKGRTNTLVWLLLAILILAALAVFVFSSRADAFISLQQFDRTSYPVTSASTSIVFV